MASDDLIRKYGWVKDQQLEAWTVAVVEGRAIDEVLRIYGGDPAAPIGEVTFTGVDELRGPQLDHLEFYLQVLTHNEHVVAIENNGWSGAFPEIARRCSADGGRFFSVYWNVNAFGLVTQAIDGTVTANFEMIYPTAPEADQWERRPGWAIGPATDIEVVRQTCMAQLEQQTGVAVDPAWLRDAQPTYRIPDPYWLYRDVPDAEHP
ncbi:MAG: hypothetical protein GEV28_09605 [Actinophytocola sp.]|uniref:DUF6461 domain-containing protein n=1 Tax=Actinophytocola sp. TaxID=1872138 RepID=UPI00132878F7|nr:DUF6461 domain-containing protein [Actinophytocola sp.]MPZ80625.1 hypothetical protein [Actinophytocola sp.]